MAASNTELSKRRADATSAWRSSSSRWARSMAVPTAAAVGLGYEEPGLAVADDVERASLGKRDRRPARGLHLRHREPEVLDAGHDQRDAARHRRRDVGVGETAEEAHGGSGECLQTVAVGSLADHVEREPVLVGGGDGPVERLVPAEPRHHEEPPAPLVRRCERRRRDRGCTTRCAAAVGAPNAGRREARVRDVVVDATSGVAVPPTQQRERRRHDARRRDAFREVVARLPHESRR